MEVIASYQKKDWKKIKKIVIASLLVGVVSLITGIVLACLENKNIKNIGVILLILGIIILLLSLYFLAYIRRTDNISSEAITHDKNTNSLTLNQKNLSVKEKLADLDDISFRVNKSKSKSGTTSGTIVLLFDSRSYTLSNLEDVESTSKHLSELKNNLNDSNQEL
jgi:uncharacterized protein YacL